VLDGDPARSKRGHSSPPLFSPCLLWPNGSMNQGALGTMVGLGPGHIVLDGSQLPPHQKNKERTHPQFSAHDCCGQTVGWSRMPLGTGVGLGPGHIVLDGDPAPSTVRGRAAPTFPPMYIVAKRLPISAAVGVGLLLQYAAVQCLGYNGNEKCQ